MSITSLLFITTLAFKSLACFTSLGESDAIKSGKTGYLCNGNDLNALYETFLKILSNEHYKDLGINALEFSKDFNWEKIIKKYINLI